MKTGMTRREILALALASPVLVAFPGIARGQAKSPKVSTVSPLYTRRARLCLLRPTDAKHIRLIRQWTGPLCRSRLINQGTRDVRVKEAVLFDLTLPLPAETRLYGEGFQMLTQTGGTLGQPTDLGNYTDAKHYKLPAPEGR